MSRRLNGEIWRNGKKFIPLNIASAACGYHREYLRQLIKNGKLGGERIGSSWFISEDVFSSFIKNNPTGVSNYSNQTNQNFGIIEKKISDLEEKLEKITASFDPVRNSEGSQREISNGVDPWDHLLLGENSVQQEGLPAQAGRNVQLKFSAVKVLVVISIISASFVFLFKNHDLVLVKSNNIKKIAEQTIQQIKSQTQLAAVSLQKTALNFPDQARSFGDQTLNQVRSLSLSLSRQTS